MTPSVPDRSRGHASPKSRRTRCHRFANNLLKVFARAWTFVTVEGVERPTTLPNARSVAPSSSGNCPTARAEMAETLVISPHTVEDHVKSLYEKLGVASRQELVARVFLDEDHPEVVRQTPLTSRGRFDIISGFEQAAQRQVAARQSGRYTTSRAGAPGRAGTRRNHRMAVDCGRTDPTFVQLPASCVHGRGRRQATPRARKTPRTLRDVPVLRRLPYAR